MSKFEYRQHNRANSTIMSHFWVGKYAATKALCGFTASLLILALTVGRKGSAGLVDQFLVFKGAGAGPGHCGRYLASMAGWLKYKLCNYQLKIDLAILCFVQVVIRQGRCEGH
ncbi:hypothetical protein EB796_002819 [Bugula neritina]|uniref:Uncharacterized protein n=1 Tax=Bugula neritina TaxID=10212 RepID=A0A7J7KLN0_BUGNE|nr:hypothetical protein EB796_002819 [Bugula neritina]